MILVRIIFHCDGQSVKMTLIKLAKVQTYLY